MGTRQALGPDGSALPGGTELLRLVPPRWNEQGQMFQLSYEGRACCMSNKNVQLANVANESSPTLQAILVRVRVRVRVRANPDPNPNPNPLPPRPPLPKPAPELGPSPA